MDERQTAIDGRLCLISPTICMYACPGQKSCLLCRIIGITQGCQVVARRDHDTLFALDQPPYHHHLNDVSFPNLGLSLQPV